MAAPLVQACSADIRHFGPACLGCTCGTGTCNFFSVMYTPRNRKQNLTQQIQEK